MNDSSVSVVSLKTVLACQAYILFYSKYSPPAPVPVPTTQTPTPTAVTAPIAGLATAPVASAASSTVVDGVNKLTPAVLIRTPASGANNSSNNILATVTATEVSSAANSKSDAVLDPVVLQKSKATINALFAAAGDVSDSEDTSSKPATSISDDAEIGSRLPERAHAFKFYGPLRYVLSELLLKV
jgi:hypothetical protein